MMIKKAIKLCKSLNKYYHRLTQSLNLANK